MGWITPGLLRHDEHAPSLLRRVLQFSAGRRQAVFAALAFEATQAAHSEILKPPSHPVDEPDLSILLRDARPAEIIKRVYGDVPDGFLGALERCGPRPMRPRNYIRLFAIFAHDRARAAALRHVGAINADRLDVIDELLPVLIDGKVVSRLNSREEARDFNKCVELVQRVCSQATDYAIRQAIGNLDPHSKLETVINRFIKRADRFPPQPFRPDEDIAPLDTVEALTFAAYRYRNCLRSQIGAALAGLVAFAEFKGTHVLELHPLDGSGWILTGVHAPRNGSVDPSTQRAARAKCASLGVSHVLRHAPGGDVLRPVARMLRRWDWVI